MKSTENFPTRHTYLIAKQNMLLKMFFLNLSGSEFSIELVLGTR